MQKIKMSSVIFFIYFLHFFVYMISITSNGEARDGRMDTHNTTEMQIPIAGSFGTMCLKETTQSLTLAVLVAFCKMAVESQAMMAISK